MLADRGESGRRRCHAGFQHAPDGGKVRGRVGQTNQKKLQLVAVVDERADPKREVVAQGRVYEKTSTNQTARGYCSTVLGILAVNHAFYNDRSCQFL